jgi:hypothetical protein
MNRKEIVRAAKRAARKQGCTCKPDIDILSSPTFRGDLGRVHVAHDSWCPLLRSAETDGQPATTAVIMGR